jgi:uncharacterized membrane protein
MYLFSSRSFVWLATLPFLRRPDKVYLWIAAVFGMVFLVVTPPCAVPDEPAHLQRVFSVAQTTLPNLNSYDAVCARIGIGQDPQYLLPQLTKFFGDKGEGAQLPIGAVSYPPVAYLPAALVVKCLSFFSPSAAIYLYAARLATFLASLLITYYALRIMPCAQWVMVVLALLPTRLFLLASVSPDSVTSAVALLWFALVLRCALYPEEVNNKKILLLASVAVLLALTKPMYSMLLLLIVVLPFKSLFFKFSYYCKAFTLLLLVAGFCCSTLLASRYFRGVTLVPATVATESCNASAGSGTNSFLANVNPSAQASMLLNEPTRLPKVLARGYASRGQSLLRQVTGVFGWANLYLSSAVYVFVYVLLVGALFMDKNITLPPLVKPLSVAIFLLALCIIPLMMYLMWTPVGARGFDGVLGRYYIPFTPLLFLALSGRGRSLYSMRLARFFIISGLILLMLISVMRVVNAYYFIPPDGGHVTLTAQANNTGVALISVKTEPQGKWKNKGVINFMPSDKLVDYDCILPAQYFSSMRIILTTEGNMDVRVEKISIRSLDRRLIKDISWNDVQQSGLQGVLIDHLKSDNSVYLFHLSKEGRSSYLVVKNLGADLRR